MKNTIKIISKIIGVIIASLVLAYLYSPISFIEVYRGDDEKSIWVKLRYLPFKKEISGTTDSYKTSQLLWSPNEKYVAFYDEVMLERLNKETELRIFNPRRFLVKTIFIGTEHSSGYKWINNNVIRVYLDAGSGVRAYRDLAINDKTPFVTIEHTNDGNWGAERTFEWPVGINAGL